MKAKRETRRQLRTFDQNRKCFVQMLVYSTLAVPHIASHVRHHVVNAAVTVVEVEEETQPK